MGTKIIVGKRRSGKTTDAILESEKTGYPILVRDRRMADYISLQADELGAKIPIPVTLRQLKNGKLDGHKKGMQLIVDEGLMLLEQILGMSIHMITMSEREEINPILDAEENEKINRDAFDALRYSLGKMSDLLTEEFKPNEKRPSDIQSIIRKVDDSVEIKQYQFIFKYEMQILGNMRDVEVPFVITSNNYSSACEKADAYVKENFQKQMTELSTIRFVNMYCD